MHLRKETIEIQERFGAYCRTGEEVDLPGITPGRIHHYRRLVNSVVRDTLGSAFPISITSLGEELWDQLVQEFFSSGIPKVPQIWRLPLEFYHYHGEVGTGERIGKPYLDDLLWFEWMEIEVQNMPDRPFPEYVSEGSLLGSQLSNLPLSGSPLSGSPLPGPSLSKGHILKERLAFNPEYEIITLEYPVHMHPAEKTPGLKGEYHVLIFRSPETGYVQFMNLSALNVHIISRLEEGDVPVEAIKGEIARASGIESGRYLDEALTKFIRDLMEMRLILGFKKR